MTVIPTESRAAACGLLCGLAMAFPCGGPGERRARSRVLELSVRALPLRVCASVCVYRSVRLPPQPSVAIPVPRKVLWAPPLAGRLPAPLGLRRQQGLSRAFCGRRSALRCLARPPQIHSGQAALHYSAWVQAVSTQCGRRHSGGLGCSLIISVFYHFTFWSVPLFPHFCFLLD